MAMTQVSVGLPIYNGETFMSRAIESVLDQDLSDLELIISDNASTDGTWDICQDYARWDKRVRAYRNQKNLGAVANYNIVFELSTSPYFMWFSHDDVLNPRYVSACYNWLETNLDYVMCCSRPIVLHESGEEFFCYLEDCSNESNDMCERFKTYLDDNKRNMTMAFGLLRRNVIKEFGLKARRVFGWDRVYFAELSLLGKFYQISEPLLYYRMRQADLNALGEECPVTKEAYFYKMRHEMLHGPGAVEKIFPNLSSNINYFRMVVHESFDLTVAARLICIAYPRVELLKPAYWDLIIWFHRNLSSDRICPAIHQRFCRLRSLISR